MKLSKKIKLFLIFFMGAFAFTACKPNETQNDEYKQGDQVVLDGVIYTYYDEENLEKTTPFQSETEYKPYYNYYYYDMSSYSEQPAIHVFEGEFFHKKMEFWPETFYDFLTYCDAKHSPSFAYFFRLRDFFPDSLVSGFIVSGYTKELPDEVVILSNIDGIPVTQIGFKAFMNAPMRKLSFLTEDSYKMKTTLIHPFAFFNCNNLVDIESNARVLSMGISSCQNLKEISYIGLFSDCSLFHLPNLSSLNQCDPRPYFDLTSQDIQLSNTCGLRKSCIYDCPKAGITGYNLYSNNGVIYYDNIYPFYIHFTLNPVEIKWSDKWFEKNGHYHWMYDEKTMQLYIPFMNNGLNINYKFFIEEGSQLIKEEADGIYVNVSYPKIIKGATYFSGIYEDPLTLKISSQVGEQK